MDCRLLGDKDPLSRGHGLHNWTEGDETWKRNFGDKTWNQVHAEDHRREREGDPEHNYSGPEGTHHGDQNHER